MAVYVEFVYKPCALCKKKLLKTNKNVFTCFLASYFASVGRSCAKAYYAYKLDLGECSQNSIVAKFWTGFMNPLFHIRQEADVCVRERAFYVIYAMFVPV